MHIEITFGLALPDCPIVNWLIDRFSGLDIINTEHFQMEFESIKRCQCDIRLHGWISTIQFSPQSLNGTTQFKVVQIHFFKH